MSKLFCCIVVVVMLVTFTEVKAAEQGSTSEIRELIVIEDMDQAGQERSERRGILKDVNIKQLMDIDTTELIDVTNMPQSEAIDAITAAGLKLANINIKYGYSDTIPAGNVMKQEPLAGSIVRNNSSVNLVIAQTEIAVEPYRLPLDASGKYVWVEKIVHRPFDAQLGQEDIRNIPIFSIVSDGINENLEKTDYKLLEARAKSIAKNLLVAWSLMNEGAHLVVVPADKSEDFSKWHLRGPFAPEYLEYNTTNDSNEVQKDNYAHIDVVHDRHQIRIMTIYQQDANSYGSPVKANKEGNEFFPEPLSARELAEYLVTLIEAHHLLFSKMDNQEETYEKLEISKTREGRIFLNICREILDHKQPVSRVRLRDVLSNMAPSLLERLDRLARSAPQDWRVRAEYGALN